MSVTNNFGVIGMGNWGKNLIRDFSKISNIKKCNSMGNSENIKWLKKNYPSIKYTSNTNEIFNDKQINAVIISTPIKTHYNLVKKALLSKNMYLLKNLFAQKHLRQQS